jgi:nicotinamide riboside transporter PnuC
VSIWWSIALTAMSFTSQWLVVEKRRAGFAVGVVQQVLWVAYAVATAQFAFIGSALLFAFLSVRGWRRWGMSAQRGEAEESTLIHLELQG